MFKLFRDSMFNKVTKNSQKDSPLESIWTEWHTCNLSTQEAKAREQVHLQGQLQFHSKYQVKKLQYGLERWLSSQEH